MDTHIIDFAKEFQIDRVSKKDTNVSFDFTEGWFRNSGLYDLNLHSCIYSIGSQSFRNLRMMV